MPHVSEAAKLYAPAERVWETVRDFTAIDQWHPAVLRCKAGLEGTQTTRELDVAADKPIVERLEEFDEKNMLQSYSILDSPLPVRDYHATLRVRRDDANSCTVEWNGSFEAEGASDEEAVEIIQTIYRKGLDHLRFLLGG
jgi:hypothetical protein